MVDPVTSLRDKVKLWTRRALARGRARGRETPGPGGAKQRGDESSRDSANAVERTERLSRAILNRVEELHRDNWAAAQLRHEHIVALVEQHHHDNWHEDHQLNFDSQTAAAARHQEISSALAHSQSLNTMALVIARQETELAQLSAEFAALQDRCQRVELELASVRDRRFEDLATTEPADLATVCVDPAAHVELPTPRTDEQSVERTPERLKAQVGRRPFRPNHPRVLVVGHAAGEYLFGAERSLLDLLDGFSTIGFDVVVAVPSGENAEYLGALLDRSSVVHVLPVPIRRPRSAPDPSVTDQFVSIISMYGVNAVHTNTILPREPLLAARRFGIPAVVHAREIPQHDEDFARQLGATASEITSSVLADADHLIANSLTTALAYPLSGRSSVVPNSVDIGLFRRPERTTTGPVRVALIGSVAARKGVGKFIEMARLLENRLDVTFVVIGPLSDYARELRASEQFPTNVAFSGYATCPADAISLADVVVNFSICQETFGRTILEAMAAGLPVVSFAQGALPELIRDGETGFLVPLNDVSYAAHRIEQLVCDEALRDKMGREGQRHAEENYSATTLSQALSASYRAILPGREALQQSASDVVIRLPSHNNSQHPNPFYVGNRARFAYCSGVQFVGSDRLVTVSTLGQRMYLIRFDANRGTSTIVAQIPTTDGDRDVSADLIDCDGNDRLLTSNCEHSSVSLYKIVGDRIEFTRSISTGDPDHGYCHGARFVPGLPDTVCATITTGRPRVDFLSVSTGCVLRTFPDAGWCPKDVAFLGSGRMVVVSSSENVGQVPSATPASKLAIVDLLDPEQNFKIIDSVVLPNVTADGCHTHEGTLYLSDQGADSVLSFDIAGDRFRQLTTFEGYSFPHAVDVSMDGSLLAVANYGTNEIRIRSLARP